MIIVRNEKKYHEFIRILRNENRTSFLEQAHITPEDQDSYMDSHNDDYRICLVNGEPAGYVGVVEGDIRICVHPSRRRIGVGSFMLKEVATTHPGALARVLRNNAASLNLFLKCGFETFAADERMHYMRRVRDEDYGVVREFEKQVARYTGATHAVAVDSCTNAIFLSCKYMGVSEVTIPSKTYLSVPQSVIHAGGGVVLDTGDDANGWTGIYQLRPYPIYDAAKRFTSGMYMPGSHMCLSFHSKKLLPIGKGGMILTDDATAASWYRRARYEGRGEMPYREDDVERLGWNMYMTPEQAAKGLLLLRDYPPHAPDMLENPGYRDLTEFSLFKESKCCRT